MSIADIEVELLGTARTLCNPKPTLSIRDALAQEIHERDQAVRSEFKFEFIC